MIKQDRNWGKEWRSRKGRGEFRRSTSRGDEGQCWDVNSSSRIKKRAERFG